MRIPPSTCAFLFGAAFAFGAYMKTRSPDVAAPATARPAPAPAEKARTAMAATTTPKTAIYASVRHEVGASAAASDPASPGPAAGSG